MPYVEGDADEIMPRKNRLDPLRCFEASLAGCSDAERQALHCDDLVDVLGPRPGQAARR